MGWKRTSIKETSSPKLVIGVLFTLGLAVFFTGSFIPSMVAQYESSDWPSVTGTVTRSEVEDYRLTKTRLRFSCAYETEKGRYEIHSRNLFKVKYSGWFGGKHKFVEEHPVGSPMTVWYDPKEPSQATTQAGLGILDPLPYLLFAVAMVGYACLCVRELMRRIGGHGRRALPDGESAYDRTA